MSVLFSRRGAAADPNRVGLDSMSRDVVSTSTAFYQSGAVVLHYVTAQATQQLTQISGPMAGGTAAAGTTLARMGIYSVAANGDLTLAASTASDTTLFAVGGQLYTRALTTPLTVVAGLRYALAPLVVCTTAPTFYGQNAMDADITAMAPRASGVVLGQTDLPASVAAASVTNYQLRYWMAAS